MLLFDRRGYRARLTEAGRELLREGRHVLHAVTELEGRVRRVAAGFEVELLLALDHLIPIARLFPMLQEFYRQNCGTRLRILQEVYGGVWDALVNGRADLVIGAAGEGPAGGGYATRALATIPFEFVVAPTHPLARLPEPLRPEDIIQYRAVSVADSSRSLPPRTAGLLSGQDVFTVSSMAAKIAAQGAGLGVGYLATHLARAEVAEGRLVIKQVTEPKPDLQLFLAWRTHYKGKALSWFLGKLRDETLIKSFFE